MRPAPADSNPLTEWVADRLGFPLTLLAVVVVVYVGVALAIYAWRRMGEKVTPERLQEVARGEYCQSPCNRERTPERVGRDASWPSPPPPRPSPRNGSATHHHVPT